MKSLRLAGVAGAVMSLAISLAPTGTIAADLNAVQQLRDTGSCAGCNLSGADLNALQAANGDLSFSNMTGADVYRAALAGANMAGATMSDANMRHADLSGADLSGAILTGTNLEGANLTGANMAAVLVDAYTTTDEMTTCADGTAGPCNF